MDEMHYLIFKTFNSNSLLLGKSPIFSHVCTSFQGMSIIRSSKSQHIVVNQFDALQVNKTWVLYKNLR